MDLQNDTFLRAMAREETEYTPVWIMRQAGRYLPEYRKVRAQAGDFMSLCRNRELAAEVTLQPLERFPLDAAIVFSDILTIPDAMGLGLSFAPGEGPQFAHPIRHAADVAKLNANVVDSELDYVYEAVSTCRQALGNRVPLIGFSGSPWTLATYMVEGSSSKDFRHTKGLLWNDPKSAHALLDTLADAVIGYLNHQSAAGAQALMIFDTWGGVLNPHQYQEFSLAYMEKIVAGLIREREGRRVPVILFTKNAGGRLAQMADAGADGLGVDWTIGLDEARRLTGDKVALQGNLDPSTLFASPEVIEQEVARVLNEYGPGPGHVFNLGHGITPHVNPDHLGYLVDAVHRLSRKG